MCCLEKRFHKEGRSEPKEVLGSISYLFLPLQAGLPNTRSGDRRQSTQSNDSLRESGKAFQEGWCLSWGLPCEWTVAQWMETRNLRRGKLYMKWEKRAGESLSGRAFALHAQGPRFNPSTTNTEEPGKNSIWPKFQVMKGAKQSGRN